MGISLDFRQQMNSVTSHSAILVSFLSIACPVLAERNHQERVTIVRYVEAMAVDEAPDAIKILSLNNK